jgi:isopenicillin-N epimerase
MPENNNTPTKETRWQSLWSLDSKVTFLNHGSFGACPTAILDFQRDLRAEMEREPVYFFEHTLGERMTQARHEVGRFLNSDAENISYVTNATSGVNTVLRSLILNADDELLVTDHEYNACRNALDYVAKRSGARVIVVPIPFPINDSEEIIHRILGKVTNKTRLALVDHITSPTGMILPIGPIVTKLREKGIDTLVDGAHAPGMLDLDLTALGAAYYTGNFHKWLCTPKGSAFLYVHPDRQHLIRPLTISHGANMPLELGSRFRLEFDWTGTEDPTAFLAVPETIRFFHNIYPGGWPAIRERNRNLALKARDLICSVLNIEPPCPDDMIGNLAAFPIPINGPIDTSSLDNDPLHLALYERYKIQIPVFCWPNPLMRLLRLSVQLYNDWSQYEYLASALPQLMEEERSS